MDAAGAQVEGYASSLTAETVNTSITEWIGSGTNWRLVRFNDAAHLRALD